MIHAAAQKRTLRRAARRLIIGIMAVGVVTLCLTVVSGHGPPIFEVTSK
jgi:hypothetical protein